MLVYFKIKNFKSIKDEVTVNLKPDKSSDRDHIDSNIVSTNQGELLKTLVFYGRNASGKSNILEAFGELKELVSSSDQYKYGAPISSYKPFKLDTAFITKPVQFEICFIHNNNIKYIFTISFENNKIIDETLNAFVNTKSSEIYKRHLDNISYGSHYKGEKKEIENDLLSNQLFLSKSAKHKIEHLNQVYSYINEDLSVNFNADINFDRELINHFSKFLMQPETKIYLKQLTKLLNAGDTNITSLKVSELKSKDNSDINVNFNQLKTAHKMFSEGKSIGETEFDLSEESAGTQKLATLSSFILTSLYIGGVCIIDEFDQSLHPLLAKNLIKLFHSKTNNPKNAQLLFATHDHGLLDFDLFRKDQICFVEKKYEGNTYLYKLSDFKGVPKDIPLDKWYLSGRFKATPVMGDFELNDEE